MSFKANITLKIGENGEQINASGEFSKDEIELLNLFEKFALELTNIELLRKGGPGKLTINYDKNAGFSYSTEMPSEDKISALLHKLRPFILDNEDTNFYKIRNILCKNFENNNFSNFMESLKKYYQGESMKGLIQITADNTQINSDKMIKTWLNAFEYHRDKDKRGKIKEMGKIFPFEAIKSLLVMIIYDKVEAIIVMANIIRVMLHKQKTFQVQLD